MLKFIQKHLFWILNGSSWLLLGLLIFSLEVRDQDEILELVVVCISLSLSGFIPTSLLRWLLIKFKLRYNLNIKKIIGIAVVIGVAVAVLLGINYGFIYFKGSNIEISVNNEQKEVGWLIGFLAFYFLMSIWTLVYIGLKQLQKFNTERLKRLALRGEVKQAQLNILRGHVNPDFMVSSIKGIQELTHTSVPKSRLYLTELSELLRFSLTKNNISEIPVLDEVKMLKKYVQLEQLKYKDLAVAYAVKGELEKLTVPPMLLLNTIELGLTGIAENEKQQWEISLEQSNSILEFTINGTFNKDKFTVLNTQRIEQRIQLLFKKEAKLSITSNAVQLIIPQFLNSVA